MQVKIPQIVWIVCVVIVFSLGFWFRNEIFTDFDSQKIGQAYGNSQYVLGDQAVNKIDDATLYQYAASAYFKGDDPTTINFEHPPLGKYLFGLSLWATGWVKLLNLIMLLGCMLLLSQLFTHFKVPTWFQVLSLLYLAFFSGLSHHLTTTLLDLQTLFWSLSFFVLLLCYPETWKKYSALGFVLGAFIATKYFFPIVFLYTGLLAIWVFHKKTWSKALLSLGIMCFIYLLSYGFYFSHGHSFVDFMKFEWYRFRWWTGNRTIPVGIILHTLFLGKFPMWWADAKTYMVDGDWNLSWPILFLAHLISVFWQKKNWETLIIWLFSLGLMGIFMIGSAVYGRYLFQLLPFWLLTIGAARHVKKS